MITVRSMRTTTEDKTKDIPEIYEETVERELKIFGIRIFRATEGYKCKEKECTGKNGKIGFK